MYLNDFEESVGTIIKSTTKTTDIDKKKACYLKTLAMNQLVDIYAFENMIQKVRMKFMSTCIFISISLRNYGCVKGKVKGAISSTCQRTKGRKNYAMVLTNHV
ncbi:hypothetical protein PS15m_009733 [Mucor circinelloides]